MCYICNQETDIQQYECYCGHRKYHLPCLTKEANSLRKSCPYPTGMTRFNHCCEICNYKTLSADGVSLSVIKIVFLFLFSILYISGLLASLYFLVGYYFRITDYIFLSGFIIVHPSICIIYVIKFTWTKTIHMVVEESQPLPFYFFKFRLVFIAYTDLLLQISCKIQYNQELYYLDKTQYHPLQLNSEDDIV